MFIFVCRSTGTHNAGGIPLRFVGDMRVSPALEFDRAGP